MNSPVKSISAARLREMLRESGTAGVEQKRPRFTPETAKRAFSEATARSHWATSWQPAAVAIAVHGGDHGLGQRDELLHHRAARGEEGGDLGLGRERAHLLQVVPGAEGASRRP